MRKIRIVIEPLMSVIMRIIALVYPYRGYARLSLFTDYLHTYWVKPSFNRMGKHSLVYRKITLIGGKHISIGSGSRISRHTILSAWKEKDNTPEIMIGDNCEIGEYNHFSASNMIKIGNGVLTGRWVTVVDNSHGHCTREEMIIEPSRREIFSKGEVVIDDNVWLGDKVTVLPGVHIGKGAIIAANSVVTKDIPPHSIAAGVPANVIRTI